MLGRVLVSMNTAGLSSFGSKAIEPDLNAVRPTEWATYGCPSVIVRGPPTALKAAKTVGGFPLRRSPRAIYAEFLCGTKP
jgi:hypothetical protein